MSFHSQDKFWPDDDGILVEHECISNVMGISGLQSLLLLAIILYTFTSQLFNAALKSEISVYVLPGQTKVGCLYWATL